MPGPREYHEPGLPGESESREKPTKEFKINKYLKLKLEDGKTVIYVDGEEFMQCKYLLLSVPIGEAEGAEVDEIKSIDEAAKKLSKRAEGDHTIMTPEAEFWGHCSNLQAWVENDYDTRLLHSNLSFPLLKKLVEAGDPKARKVFKDEIFLRLESKEENVAVMLIEKGYLSFLNEEEVEVVVLEALSIESEKVLSALISDKDCFSKLSKRMRKKVARKAFETKNKRLTIYLFEYLNKDERDQAWHSLFRI